MSNLVGSASLDGFLTSLVSDFGLGIPRNSDVTATQSIEFKDILSGQEQLSELIAQLEALAPAEQFAAVVSQLGIGNDLPPRAEVAGELPAAITPEAVQTLLAGLGLIRRPSTGSDPLKGGLAVQAGTPDRSGVGWRTGSVNAAAPGSSLDGTIEQRFKAVAPAMEPNLDSLSLKTEGELLPVRSSVDLIGPGLATPLAAMLPRPIRPLPVADGLDAAPSGQLNMMSGVMGSTALDTPTAPRSMTQPVLDLAAPLGKGNWEQGLGERVLWLVGHSVQGASLRINPPHLGPIEIQLSLQNEQASVSFNAQHAVVREALEAAVPRLREMFGESNLQLVNVDIGQRDSGESRSQAGSTGANPDADGDAMTDSRDQGESSEEDSIAMAAADLYRSDGLLDDYA